MTLVGLALLAVLPLGQEDLDEFLNPPPRQEAGKPAPGQPSAASAKEGKAEAAKTPDQLRLEKFLQTRFDRRESVILKSMAPPKEDPPAKPAAATPVPAKPVTGKPAEEPPKPKKSEVEEAVEREIERLRKDVTRGAWGNVKKWLAALPAESGVKAYEHLVLVLLTPQMPLQQQVEPWMGLAMAQGLMQQPQMAAPQQMEQNVFLPDDVLGLADASPVPLKEKMLEKLGLMLRMSLLRGNFLDGLLARLQAGTDRLGGKDPANRNAAVRLLMVAQRTSECGKFLPPLAEAKDPETLTLIARHEQSVNEKEKAWHASLALLALKDADAASYLEALERALRLVPQISESLGKPWVEESFTRDPERGIRIVTTVGALASENRHRDAKERLGLIKLQSLAVEALLRSAGDRATDWGLALNLMGLSWLREAELTRAHTAPQQDWEPQYDDYGNVYYGSRRFRGGRGGGDTGPVIEAVDLLETRPSDAWLARVDESLRPKYVILGAQLQLKAGDETKAFAGIERVAATHPKEARELVNDFLRVWTDNHDPNKDRRRTNRYMYTYGYNPQAESIPLTRSQQVRNLEELSRWVEKLRALPVGELDEGPMVAAFTTSHSTAEVYRIGDIERVFGSIDRLKPETLSKLVHTMRSNLAGVWRKADTQQKQGTKRKDKEIEAEILRGYQVADQVLGRALEKYPDHWALHLARAAVGLDENVYRSELKRSPDYTARREAAFASFRRAAELYAAALKGLAENQETGEVFEYWFYASLGAADLAALKADQPTDPRQQEAIRKALTGLPGLAAERHLGRFANALTTRLGNVKPELKHRYLKGGLLIAGEHKLAREARKLFEYYDDLVTEIKLRAQLDGPAAVGHGKPFGLFVDLRHTKEIEREAGGFSRYLQNQQSGGRWYWNFGRAPADYRDRFEETAREALRERFEVVSVTFHSDKIESRGDPAEGWRVTPYAYLLLKARGPEVDAVPPLRLDLDFLDTAGYSVLPIETARVPIDASAAVPRPMEKLKVVQTLDERKRGEGKLTLEIKATARGLIPPLETLLDLPSGPFEIVKTEDAGVSISGMDGESEANSVLSERSWEIEFRLPEGARAGTFRFAGAKLEGTEAVYQRYVDADLTSVGPEVELGGGSAIQDSAWPFVVGALALGGVAAAAAFLVRRSRRKARPERPAYAVPAEVNPFSVLNLLRRMRQDAKLAPEMAAPLEESIARVEQYHFNRGTGDAPDLREIAASWVGRWGNGSGR